MITAKLLRTELWRTARQGHSGMRRRCNEPAFGLITDRGRRILSETYISFNINKINGFYHCRERLEKSDLSENLYCKGGFHGSIENRCNHPGRCRKVEEAMPARGRLAVRRATSSRIQQAANTSHRPAAPLRKLENTFPALRTSLALHDKCIAVGGTADGRIKQVHNRSHLRLGSHVIDFDCFTHCPIGLSQFAGLQAL